MPWYIYENGSKKVNPEYKFYKYWNVQGYTPEGNIWYKIDSYFLKSPTGQLLKTYTSRPPELGVASTKYIGTTQQGKNQYRITITYPDKVWTTIDEYAYTGYTRDAQGRIYIVGDKQVVRYSDCGKEMARLKMPETTLWPLDEKIPDDYPEGQELPRQPIKEEYGTPVLAPNGDVYTWKRTKDKYSIVKWTWVDEPGGQLRSGRSGEFEGCCFCGGVIFKLERIFAGSRLRYRL